MLELILEAEAVAARQQQALRDSYERELMRVRFLSRFGSLQ